MTSTNYIRFMDNNHAALTGGQITVSSELAAFPFTNAINPFRSKVWKPSGHFEITATNNLVYINDGSNKTATIVVGSYDTPALLKAQIQTQLNTVSSGWTVNYNSVAGEYRFSFAHASAHTIRLSQSTNAIWDTIGMNGGVDVTVSTEYFAIEQRNHTSEYVIFDLGYNSEITFFGLVGALGEAFSISESATITLKGNNLNDFTSPPLTITLSVSPGGILKFLDDAATNGYRFWKFEFEDMLNPSGPEGFSFGYLYLGDHTVLSRNISTGFQKTIKDPSIASESESGAIYYDKKIRYTIFSNSSISYLSKDDRDTIEQLFFDYGTFTPFFISIDPELCISNDLYDLTKYVTFQESPTFTHIKGELFSMSISFREAQ